MIIYNQNIYAYTTYFWSPGNYRMHYCHLHLPFTYIIKRCCAWIPWSFMVFVGTNFACTHFMVSHTEIVSTGISLRNDNHTDRGHFPAHNHENFCEHMISSTPPASWTFAVRGQGLVARWIIGKKEELWPWIGRSSMLQQFQPAF